MAHPTAITIDVRPYRELAAHEIEEWEALAERVTPAGTARLGSELRWADLDPTTDSLIRLREDGALCACAWVTRRTIDIADRELRVAGIRGVATDPDHRHRGFGRAVMERAQELMCSFCDCEIAVLFSSVMAVGFYERLGWQAIAGPVTVDQPGRRLDYTGALPTAPVMAQALRRDAVLPEGPVDVRGFPW